tara:strand:- start:297 stop:788 length:492 start_codon:yes stop_codon:yes gene_type:complete
MPQLDISGFSPQIFWLILSFLSLWWLMAKVALPKVGLVLEERQIKINDSLELAKSLQREAEAEIEAYESTISEARENARKIINDATLQGTQDNLTQQLELRASLTKKIALAEDEIEAAKDRSLESIHQSAKEVAAIALNKLGGITLTEEKLNVAINKSMKTDK